MTDQFKDENSSHGLIRRYKDTGDGGFAEVIALEPASIGAGGGGGGTAAPVLAASIRGANAALTVGSTATLISVSGPVNFRGYLVTGNADAYVEILSDGSLRYADRINFSQPSCSLLLNSHENITGTTITLRVTNNGVGTGDFEAVMLLE